LIVYGCATSGPTVVKQRKMESVVEGSGGKAVETVSCRNQTDIKLTVGKVKCVASGCQSSGAKGKGGLFALLQLAGVPSFEGIGKGLKDMYMSSLQKVGCFKLLDREAMEEIRKEQELMGVKPSKMEAADYSIMASVTSINFERKSGSLGGGFIPIVGAISRTKQKATLGMDVRVVAVQTGEVVYSNTYMAESGKTSYGVAGLGFGGGVGFGGSLSGLSGTAMEEVARDILIRSTNDIVAKLVPENQIVRKVSQVKKE